MLPRTVLLMYHSVNLDAGARTFRDVTDSTSDYGGKLVLLIGRFSHTVLVIPARTLSQIASPRFNTLPLYRTFFVLHLEASMQIFSLSFEACADLDTFLFTPILFDVSKRKLCDTSIFLIP